MIGAEIIQKYRRKRERPPSVTATAWGSPDGDYLPIYDHKGLHSIWDMRNDEWHEDFVEYTDEQWLARLHQQADEMQGCGVCYFVGHKDDGLVKIGFATNLRNRISNMQSNSPIDLTVLATADGGPFRERAYHFQFDEHRVRGEWFARVPEIEAEVARLSAAPHR